MSWSKNVIVFDVGPVQFAQKQKLLVPSYSNCTICSIKPEHWKQIYVEHLIQSSSSMNYQCLDNYDF